MKQIIVLILAAIAALGMSAQTVKVITGVVTDRNGNPLPNALVESTGGAENVTTEADGTFRIEVPATLKSLTAKYAGMRDKKITIKGRSEMIFELEKEDASCWFLNGAFSANYGHAARQRIGAMGGYLGNWGGYAKLLVEVPGSSYGLHPSATAGVIKQIAKPMYLYLGAGYAAVYGRWDREPWEDTEDGAAFEGGAIFKFKSVNFSLGYAYNTSFGNFINHSIQTSVGYCF